MSKQNLVSFEFSVKSEQGLNLVVDLNSTPSDYPFVSRICPSCNKNFKTNLASVPEDDTITTQINIVEDPCELTNLGDVITRVSDDPALPISYDASLETLESPPNQKEDPPAPVPAPVPAPAAGEVEKKSAKSKRGRKKKREETESESEHDTEGWIFRARRRSTRVVRKM